MKPPTTRRRAHHTFGTPPRQAARLHWQSGQRHGNGQTLTASGTLAGGSIVTYTITVRVDAAFSGSIANSATLSGDGQTRTLTAPPVTVAPPSTPASFVGSTKMVNATTVTAGQVLTYTLTVVNSGELAANYTLVDTLDSHLTLVNAGGMNVNGQTLTATGVVAGGASVVYTIVVRVDAAFTGSIANSAVLSGDGQTRTLTAPVVTVTAAPPTTHVIYLPLLLNGG